MLECKIPDLADCWSVVEIERGDIRRDTIQGRVQKKEVAP